jgi:hypothetical protein
MSIKRFPNGWLRDTNQEDGKVVFRWYEKQKGGIIASLVKGEIANEGEWRISGDNLDSIESRGDINLMERKSDENNIRTVESLIRREKMR